VKNFSDEEFRDLLIRHKTGDKSALEILVKEGQSYIAYIADKEITRLSDSVFSLGLCSVISWEDLMQSGNVGLINALNNFNPSVGDGYQNITKKWFSGYAHKAIVWAMRRFIVSSLFIKTSGNLYKNKFLIVQPMPKTHRLKRATINEKSDLTDLMQKILELLPKEDREAITLHYGLDGEEPKTLEEVARHFGKTYNHIRGVVIPRALNRIKKIYKDLT
jgi:RNA polymerase sigma factor (sigma-70 family)